MKKFILIALGLALIACNQTNKDKKKGDSVKIVVYGDSQSDHKIHKQICKLISYLKPDAVFHAGDLVEHADDTTEWMDFNKESQTYRKKIPFYPVIGNHDTNYINFHKFIPTPDNRNYYSKDFSDLHVVFLDSNESLDDSSVQYKWLQQDLDSASKKSKAIIAIFHHPPFGCDKDGNDGDEKNLRGSIVPLFDLYDVKLVFSGHNHLYERIKHKDTWYVITGGGGGNLHQRTKDCHPSDVSVSNYHLCELIYKNDEICMKVYLTGKAKIDELHIKL